jgi:hypothetical protein
MISFMTELYAQLAYSTTVSITELRKIDEIEDDDGQAQV